MLKYIFCLVSLIIVQINCQDTSFCDVNKIPQRPIPLSVPDFNIGKYQASIERNVRSRGYTEEISEYFDGDDNIGVSHSRLFGNINLRTYSYYDTNELLLISADGVCSVKKLNESFDLSPFYVVFDANGKEKILSPLQFLLKSEGFGPLTNTDDSMIRGIPANNWQTCAFSTKTGATLKITLSFADTTLWTGADIKTTYPLAVKIESKLGEKYDTDIHSVTEFRTFIKNGDEEFFTPSGVYCPGRQNVAPLPVISKRFQFEAEIIQPFFMDLVGTINETREQYDFEENLFRQDFSVYNSLVTEIHDFVTGIKFRLDENSGTCQLDKIDPNGVDSVIVDGVIKIRDPSAFFDFDSNNFQYTGRRLKNGVNTDVWIGQKNIGGLTGTFEWYFLTAKWTDVDTIGENISIPISCIITIDVPNPNTNIPDKTSAIYSFSNFEDTKSLLLNHDISRCGKGIEKRFFSFKIACDLDRSLIKQKWLTFNNHILKEIRKASLVAQIRITNFDIIMSDNIKDDIIVKFELFDNIGFYGNVPIPQYDVSLKTATANLEKSIDQSLFKFTLKLPNNKNHDFVATPKTLSVFRKKLPGELSSGAVAAITVVVTIVGIALSLTLMILHKAGKIRLPFI